MAMKMDLHLPHLDTSPKKQAFQIHNRMNVADHAESWVAVKCCHKEKVAWIDWSLRLHNIKCFERRINEQQKLEKEFSDRRRLFVTV